MKQRAHDKCLFPNLILEPYFPGGNFFIFPENSYEY